MFKAWLAFMVLMFLVFACSVAFTSILAALAKKYGKKDQQTGEEDDRRQRQEAEKKKVNIDKKWKDQLKNLGTADEQKKAYAVICSNRWKFFAPQEEGIVNNAQAAILESIRTLCIMYSTDREPTLKSLETKRMEALKILAGEFDKISAMTGIENIFIDNDEYLVICTEAIELKHSGGSINLGRFSIKISGSYEIALAPIDVEDESGEQAVLQGRIIHPSIRGKTILMKPGLRLSIAKLLASHKISDVVAILLDFLKTYDPELAFKELLPADAGKEN